VTIHEIEKGIALFERRRRLRERLVSGIER
jgi:hypothetical protein